MCGIVGTTTTKVDEVDRASKSLEHRGPDQSGVFSDGKVTFGHRRLSIIDLSDAGRQPMSLDDERFVVTYNGEIYNFKILRADLEERGVKFKTKSDTEVILEGYRQEGLQFFEKLRGMWAFALYDRKKDIVILSRDQFGIKPLYYSILGGRFCFASEMKALKELGVPQEPNTDAFYTFFSLGYFISPQTCYKDIFQLEAGEVLTYSLVSKKMVKTKLKTSSSNLPKNDIKVDGYIENLNKVLLESVQAHFTSDVPVGILFSGGNDSSLIAALSKKAGFSPKAYHLAIEGSSDTGYAERISRHIGLEAEIIPMSTEELVHQYESVWDTLDVPFADVSIIPTSLIYKKIAGRSKVVLSGEGGDELFGAICAINL